ncbi:MAG TPA: ferrous iron transport protein B [Tenuifilaceae bacterium]|nr:ferrous iron transport protein B [Tenuifilaceae bacterium]HPE18799.1 ferrous iron transport protein B [Tenuifilaceae bacterium]HPJ45998.1 ferrous iron transport protein B [Tenuifilaceae bacterium]HPQ34378.1 ferrous iron transport protein B [Tenuifilaceae bacterium]HRX68538.1 ferrous iron transport protein B [Tenuifilaceae bacterium]
MLLSELQNGEYGIVSKVRGRGAFRKRITEMGFVKGKKVTVVKNAPLRDPIEYSVLGYEISLRRSEASLIEVITPNEAKELLESNFQGVITTNSEEEIAKTGAKEGSKIVNVALVGNPNSGKTTLFNIASGSREHVGNYSGVTVDSKQARFKYKGYTFHITDLPGTYSLTAYTPEELYVRRFIHEQKPDVVVNVVDASNLERNLYLTTQLIDMDIKVVVALNMFDELLTQGDKFHFKDLGKMIGIPFIPTVGSKGKGINQLFDTVINVYTDKDKTLRHIHINYGEQIERAIEAIQVPIKKSENTNINVHYSSRYLAIKLLEKDKQAHRILSSTNNYKEISEISTQQIKKLEDSYNEDSETLITDAKYGFVAGALKETYQESPHKKHKNTQSIDNFITHKVFGFPIFLIFMWVTFYTTFRLGAYPMDWIDAGVSFLSNFFSGILPDGAFKDLLVDGIINGVGSVIIFLPNILILFFFISLLEDTGYMARAVFIMDKLMHKIGLHGKSFIPLIMGFGCNVPAIMATRTIENRNNRILTMLINPFMSCSARLPVYILILGAFFPERAGSLLFLIYLIGIGLAILMAIIFKNTLFRGEDIPFVMELPPYRIPTIRSTFRHMWHKGSQYLQKMGGVILVAVIIIWALEYYPQNKEMLSKYDKQIEVVKSDLAQQNLKKNQSLPTDSLQQLMQIKIQEIKYQRNSERQANSFIGRIGKFIEPVIRPLGFDWKMGVSLLSGVAAKEIVVSTLGVLVQADVNDESNNTLIHKLQTETYTSGPRQGENVYTPISAFSFILFILIYFPCVAVIAAIKKESGSWKWAAFTIVYTTSLAWIVSFLFYQIASIIVN